MGSALTTHGSVRLVFITNSFNKILDFV